MDFLFGQWGWEIFVFTMSWSLDLWGVLYGGDGSDKFLEEEKSFIAESGKFGWFESCRTSGRPPASLPCGRRPKGGTMYQGISWGWSFPLDRPGLPFYIPG